MHEPYRLAEKVASPSTTRRVALVAWGMSVCLILSATVIWFLEGDNLLQYAQYHQLGHRFRLFWHRRHPDYLATPKEHDWLDLSALLALGLGLPISVERIRHMDTVKGQMPLARN